MHLSHCSKTSLKTSQTNLTQTDINHLPETAKEETPSGKHKMMLLHKHDLHCVSSAGNVLPVSTHLLCPSRFKAALVCWAFEFRIVCPSSNTILSHLTLCKVLSPLIWNAVFFKSLTQNPFLQFGLNKLLI